MIQNIIRFPRCLQAGHMHIRIDNSSVILSRCCMRDNEILDTKNIKEFLSLNPFEWCQSFFRKNPTPHNFKCEYFKEKCDYTKDRHLKCIEVAISQACNLKCPMCFVKSHKDTNEMKKAYFHTLYSLNGKVNSVRLTDRGEPFFWKKETLEFLEQSSFKEVICTSNATLLDKEDIVRLSNLPYKINVTVSLDSLKPEIYKQIRGVDSLQKVMENINLLSQCHLLSAIHSVIQDCNKDELNELRSFSENLGVRFEYGNLY